MKITFKEASLLSALLRDRPQSLHDIAGTIGLNNLDITRLGHKIEEIRDTLKDTDESVNITESPPMSGPDAADLSHGMVQRLVDGESPVQVWREHRGLSLRELARRSGLAAFYIADIENGRKTGSVSALKKLATALDVDTGDLI